MAEGTGSLAATGQVRRNSRRRLGNGDLYLLLAPALIYFVLFHYLPMFGVVLAFKDFRISKGIWFSPWVGIEHFEKFFGSYFFPLLLRNTLTLSLYTLVSGFPVPIILALMLNQVTRKRFRKTTQTILYAPHFVSVVIVVSLMRLLLSPSSGVINLFIERLGGEPIFFFAKPQWFRHLYVLSNIWQHAGFGAIIYLAALSSIDPNLYEAAAIDGATKMQRVARIDVPLLVPTIVILLILAMGRVMTVGFEKVLLMQTPGNLETSQVIATYVYEVGLGQGQFDFGTAVGLFNSVVNLVLILSVNALARKLNQTALI